MSRENAAHSSALQQLHLLPGFRFHPTDEELIVHYLSKKAESKPFPVPIISEVELYKFKPWELPEKALFGEREWYFFTPRDRKYPNGARPNRAASTGYWKATGTDKPIFFRGNKRIGIKKALVYYDAKPPLGVKTNWIMHEYRLVESSCTYYRASKDASLRLDEWVLCRIYEKTGGAFKAMTSNHAAKSEPKSEPDCYELEPEPEPEPEPELEPEADQQAKLHESEPGWHEILASLPELDSSVTSLSAPLCTTQSLDDFLNSPAAVISDQFNQGQYLNDSPEIGDSSKSSNLFNDSTWYVCQNSFNEQVLKRKPDNINDILQQVEGTRKRTRFNIEDDDERSTCTSPIPCARLKRSLVTRTM